MIAIGDIQQLFSEMTVHLGEQTRFILFAATFDMPASDAKSKLSQQNCKENI